MPWMNFGIDMCVKFWVRPSQLRCSGGYTNKSIKSITIYCQKLTIGYVICASYIQEAIVNKTANFSVARRLSKFKQFDVQNTVNSFLFVKYCLIKILIVTAISCIFEKYSCVAVQNLLTARGLVKKQCSDASDDSKLWAGVQTQLQPYQNSFNRHLDQAVLWKCWHCCAEATGQHVCFEEWITLLDHSIIQSPAQIAKI